MRKRKIKTNGLQKRTLKRVFSERELNRLLNLF